MSILTAADLRDRLVDILGDAAGKYSTPQGQIPAVRIFDQKLPLDWKMVKDSAASAEVIIPVNPDVVSFAKNMHQSIVTHQWEIRITLHELATKFSEQLYCIIERFSREDMVATYVRIPPSDMSSEQYIVTISQPVIIQH
jgi:hypothetical protein